MTGTVQRRAAALLRSLLAEHGTRAEELASRLGERGVELRRMIAGESGIELDRLDGVLEALEVSPSEFFARLYGPPDSAAGQTPAEPPPGVSAPGASESPAAVSPEDAPISRREVEELLAELRSTIHGMVRLIDAEREPSASDGDGDGGG